MTEPADGRHLITIDHARDLTKSYLLKRYYDFEKIVFSSHDLIHLEDSTIYRLHGSIKVKSRSMLDQIGFMRKSDSYKFMAELDALSGKILNYEFK